MGKVYNMVNNEFAHTVSDIVDKIKQFESQLEAMEELCYDFYSAGLSAGHPMITSKEAEMDYKDLKDELNKIKEGK